jgi:hypothetical protein
MGGRRAGIGYAGGIYAVKPVCLLTLGLASAVAGCSHSSSPHAGGENAGVPGAAALAVKPLVPAKSIYDVTLKPQTKLIDTDTMAHAYRGATANGTLTFDAAAAPEVAALKPGTVVIFAGVALLNVSSVSSSGGTVSVAGTPAGLEDAIDHGHIAWTTPLDFNKVAFNAPAGFHRVRADASPVMAFANFLVPPAEAGFSLADNTWKGKIKDWDVTIALTPSAGNLHLDMHAVKSIGGGTIDAHGVGQLNGFTNEGSITLSNGSTTEITFNNKGISGSVDFSWKVAFDAEHGGNDPKMRESDVENFPFSLDLPAPVGPIPFKLTFKTGFAFVPFFTSKVAVAEGTYHASFGGDIPMTDTAGSDAASPGASAAAAAEPGSAGGTQGLSGSGSIDSYGGTTSIAAIGLSTTIALPRIGFTLGLPAPLNAFLNSPDFGGPFAMLQTQANFLATGTLSLVQCEKRELKLMGVVGYKPGILGKLKVPAVPPKIIFEKAYSEIRPPNITLCNH